MAKAKETTFQKESAALPDSPASLAPSAAMVALFKNSVDLTKALRLNTPQMVLPKSIPVGSIIAGEVVKVIDSPATNIKGKCLWLSIATETGVEERLFPVNGYVRKAMAPACKADSKELTKELEGYIGKTLAFKRMENRFSSQFQRDTFPFDVFVLK